MRVLAVTNMYPSPEAPGSGVFVEQQVEGLLSVGVQVRVVFIDRRREGPLAYYRMAPKIRSAMVEFGPDLIHVMYGGVMADQLTRWRDSPPVVITFHGSDLLGENLSGFVRKCVSHYGVHCSRKAARKAGGVVVVARHLVNALNGSISHDKLRVISCGIDLDRFKPIDQTVCQERLGWQADCFHVLFASNNGDPVKRPALARAAVEQIAKHGIRVQLHLLSGVLNSEVPVWINASDVLLLTSLHEGSPTIVKESLACGVPIVSVDVGDLAERVEGIEGCYLANPEPADLALKLRLVLERGKRLGCRPRLEDLSHITSAHKLKQFYQEVLVRSGVAAGKGDILASSSPVRRTPQEL